jgi:hypothetical protein
MDDAANKLTLSFLWLKLSATGAVARLLAVPVSALLIALAWRLAFH